MSYATFFRESIGSNMLVSFEFLIPYGVGYSPLIRKLEKKFMEGWFGEHSAHGGGLSLSCVTKGGGEELQHSPYYLLEDKQHFGGEDCNIPNYPKPMGIFNFVSFFYCMNKCVEEDNKNF